MRRKSLMAAGVGLICVLLALVVLAVLLRHEPDFYHEHAVEAGGNRTKESNSFVHKLTNFLSDIFNEQDRWQTSFSELEINSYFDEDFVKSGAASKMLPENISGPRIVIEDERLRLAFRYGAGHWSTVVSADMKIWKVPTRPNCIALEVLRMRAGAVPISPQAFLEDIELVAEKRSIDITRYRHNGNPVLVLAFTSDKARMNTELTHLDISRGRFNLKGRTRGPASAQQATQQLPTRDLVPKTN